MWIWLVPELQIIFVLYLQHIGIGCEFIVTTVLHVSDLFGLYQQYNYVN